MLPGAAVSPGARIWSLVKAPAPTARAGLVLLTTAGCVMSAALTVALPAVLSVPLKLPAPATNAALAGSAAFASLAVIATVSLVLTVFQLASTALTATLNAMPAVCATGAPALPVVVPGAAV